MSAASPDTAAAARAADSRRRRVAVRLLLGVLLLVGLGGAVWGVQALFTSAPEEDYLTCRAQLAEFNFDITERGELESSASLEVRCEVESKNSNGTKIIEIVPEGTTVKAGDLLVRFDDSGLRNDRAEQEIKLNTQTAAVTQAKNELDAAELAKREYELGTFPQEKQKAESELFVAKENLSRAEESLAHKRRLVSKGFATQTALDAEFFAVAKFRRELAVADTKLNVLEVYTQVKTLRKHETDIDTAKVKLLAEEAKLKIEQEKLTLIDEQIQKCVVRASRAGQVIYDHSQDRWGGNEHVIKEGTFVYERRVVIEMPDPAKMQVLAKIPESRIDKLKPGMTASIEIEGLPGVQLAGVVTKVNAFPAEGNWYNSSVKQYETTIDIPNPPAGLRPGMTAQVSIRAEHLDSALQVPLLAVAEINGGHYCLHRRADGSLVPKPVLLGSSNEKHLVITQGLAAEEELVLDPRSRLTKLEALPAALVAAKSPGPAEPPVPKPQEAQAPAEAMAQSPTPIPGR